MRRTPETKSDTGAANRLGKEFGTEDEEFCAHCCGKLVGATLTASGRPSPGYGCHVCKAKVCSNCIKPKQLDPNSTWWDWVCGDCAVEYEQYYACRWQRDRDGWPVGPPPASLPAGAIVKTGATWGQGSQDDWRKEHARLVDNSPWRNYKGQAPESSQEENSNPGLQESSSEDNGQWPKWGAVNEGTVNTRVEYDHQAEARPVGPQSGEAAPRPEARDPTKGYPEEGPQKIPSQLAESCKNQSKPYDPATATN